MASLPYPRCQPRECSCLRSALPLARARTAPTKQAVKKLPRNAPNTQNLLQRRASHRCRRVWHSCHTHAAKFCEFCEFCGRKEIPTERTELTEPLAKKSLPQISTDVHRYRRVWHPCHTHAAKFCEFCEFCGRTAHPKYLCRSVKSVGEYTQQEVLCKSVKSVGGHSRRRGYGKMPYPPKEESVGGHIIKL